MPLANRLFDMLLTLGLNLLVERLQTDWLRAGGHWRSHSCDRKQICSFLNIYLDHNDGDARLTLCPLNEAEALLQEIITDVIPVIRKKLGV